MDIWLKKCYTRVQLITADITTKWEHTKCTRQILTGALHLSIKNRGIGVCLARPSSLFFRDNLAKQIRTSPQKRGFFVELGCRSNIRWYSLLYRPSNTTSICLWSRQREYQVNQRKARHTANAHLAAWCCFGLCAFGINKRHQKAPRWAPDHCSYRHDNEVDQCKKWKVALQPNRS